MQSSAPTDWLDLAAEPHDGPTAIDPQQRLRWGKYLFALGTLIVLSRVLWLEWTQGDAFRQAAAQPIERRLTLPGIRGRILSRDGVVLALDQEQPALAVRYRLLEHPPDARWLRSQARARLKPNQRKDKSLVAAAEGQIVAEQRRLHERLAGLCGLSPDEWQRRAARIQQQVMQIARKVNDRSLQADTIVVAEELDYHLMAEAVPLEVVAEIEGNPARYPGVRIEQRRRRHYPQGSLAAHTIGHLGPAEQGDPVGAMGLESFYETTLQATRGLLIEQLHRNGDIVSTQHQREPGIGRDITLTLDLDLQRTAEALLDSACHRRDALTETPRSAGGAVIVMDVHSGAILAAASAPRFDPNLFTTAGDAESRSRIVSLLKDPAHPLFDRTCRMALPPGSVFKPITAAALLESGSIDPDDLLPCRGYLHRPDTLRCLIYARQGIGHGNVNLSRALATSCNVYVYHHAGALGAAPLVDWADRFGLGRATGIDLPSEAKGQVPQPLHGWSTADTQSLAIGQSQLTVTPLQIACAFAALANGGSRVHPHLVNSISSEDTIDGPLITAAPQPIEGLTSSTLESIRKGLNRVVADPEGTAHETVYLSSVAVAGKTGTAETGGGLPDHAWFAGYAPAEAPKAAIVVVIEHGGQGSTAAGPVARRMIEQMQRLWNARPAARVVQRG